MEKSVIGKYTRGYGLSFAVTSVVSAILVILKETHEDTLLAAMKSMTGHHWVTHGVFDIILFVILGWVLSASEKGVNISANGLINSIVGASVASFVLIAGFYLLH